MKYRSALFSASFVLVAVAASPLISRHALGVVVDGCKLNASLTGAPFPCLKIVNATPPLASYAILREPVHKERTILTPLVAIAGIEDPRLLAADGPNYFDSAWKERSIVLAAFPQKDPWQDAALAINAAPNRTQDHLHVHIGCVAADLKSVLSDRSRDIAVGKFEKMRTRLEWRSFWVGFYPGDSLSGINPFRIVANGVPGTRGDMEDVAIGVVGAAPRNGKPGFYVLAEKYGEDDSYGSAEDLLDPKCRR